MSKQRAEAHKRNAAKLSQLADELARLTEAREKLEETIVQKRSEMLTELGPLDGPHTEVRGKVATWDVRSLPVSTVAWKAVAEHMQAPTDLIKMHTKERLQVSFQRLIPEATK